MNSTLKNIVVGTAGHIDHGKTALVKALTGIDTDILIEEKEKGITIEAGFACHRLPSGQELSIIDVPGHEKFIKNMLRGISGVDIVMLVIAADDGPMPQTREHLSILSLLQIQHGFVVITKADLVDEGLLQLAVEEIHALLKGAFLEDSPCIFFSARTGRGIPEINHALEQLSQKVIEKSNKGIFRLPIDRVFTMKGYGTVVTGTIVSGRVREGDECEVYPAGERVKVRGIEVHGQKVPEAVAGQRAGINIPQLSVSELERGMVLAEIESLTATHLLNAHFHYLSSNNTSLLNRTKVKFHCGTSESVGRVVFLDDAVLVPGRSCLVQFRLEKKVSLNPFDRYIVRSLSPVTTIGGGMILESTLKKYRSLDGDLKDYLHLLVKGLSEPLVEKLIEKAKFCTMGLSTIAQSVGSNEEEIRKVTNRLLQKGKVVDIGNKTFIHAQWYDSLHEEIIKRMKEFYCKNPLERNISREELKSKIGGNLTDRAYAFVIDDLVRQETVLLEDGRIMIQGREIRSHLHPSQRNLADRIEQVCQESNYYPLSLHEMQERFKNHPGNEFNDAIKALISERMLIKLTENRILHRESLEDIQHRVKEFVTLNGTITIQEYKKIFSVSRMAAQVVLEYLDEIKMTLRIGDKRKLR